MELKGISTDNEESTVKCHFCHTEKAFADVWCEEHGMYHHLCPACFLMFDKVQPKPIEEKLHD